jgi:DNA polymerase-1
MTLPSNGKDRFLAIDANAIVHRAFHAYPPTLTTEDGVQVNAVYGFTVMLLSALKSFEPKYVLCAFDTHEPTFRHEEYPDYKGTRAPTDQSLIDQFPLVEEILKAFNIPIIKKDGFEADDILGTIAKYVSEKKWSNENMDLYILSGDRDLLQLVSENVRVCLPNGGFKDLVAYDREKTYEYMDLYPEQIVDFKALAGDPSDNIPGIKGIGKKTAIELLEKYGDLDTIYHNLKDIKTRQANLLREGVEQAEMSRKLAKIDQEVDVTVHLEDCLLRDFDKRKVLELFKEFSFKSLIARLDEIESNESNNPTSQLDIFSTDSEVEWTSKEEFELKLSNAKTLVLAKIPLEESLTESEYYMARIVDKNNVKEDILCKELCYTDSCKCETTLYQPENSVSQRVWFEGEQVLDVRLFAHLINSERRGYTLKDLSFDYSSYILPEKISPNDLTKVLDALEEIRENQIKKANDIELYDYTRKSIERELKIKEVYLLNVLRQIEIPISKILSKMENRGIGVDINRLSQMNDNLDKQVKTLTQEIYDSVGHEFNINSPKQLSDVLFNELNLPNKNKGSTKESVLVQLKGAHPMVEKLLEYRELSKMLTTYTKPLLEMASENEEDGRGSIHTSFNQTGTTSGRFSSSNPNMQNIPLKGEWAEELRKSFVPRKGFKFVGMDYSQIELRIMADISRDDLLIKDFNDGLDIHKATVARLLDKEVEEVTNKERSLGKTVNFAVLFGQTAYGLANMLGIDSEVAADYIQSYFEHYKGVEEYIRGLEKEAYKKGYVQSMFGTTRHIKGLRSKNIRMMRAAQREAINMPIQGSEADIMKLAMIKLDEMIEEKFKEKAYTLLQIHDELIFEIQEDKVNKFTKEAESLMEGIVSLEVPLVVHSSVGNNMAELK